APLPSMYSSLSLHDALPISLLLTVVMWHSRLTLRIWFPETLMGQPTCSSVTERREPLNWSARTVRGSRAIVRASHRRSVMTAGRSEEHTSELLSRGHLVCRL